VTPPPFEVADIVQQHGEHFLAMHGGWLTSQHRGVLRAIARCRTAALGGHRDRCSQCDHRAISDNSCRNRHCPKCLTHAPDQWRAARGQARLPVGYHHVVFTLPHDLSWLALQNKTVVYDLLFRASAATRLEVAADARHLGAAIGFLSVLHTWGQNLLHHPHVHCVIPVGGLSPDGARWVRPRSPFFLPVTVLSRVFRGKFVAGLKRAFRRGVLALPGRRARLADPTACRAFLRRLFRHDWVVYAKPPFGGPTHVLHDLARYTHRVAISNHRIVNVADDQVTFRWKDYAHGGTSRTMTVGAHEFLRRFSLHVLPKGFVRSRFFGFLARRRRGHDLPRCRAALAAHVPQAIATPTAARTTSSTWPCPRCGGTMIVIERLTMNQIRGRAFAMGIFVDTSSSPRSLDALARTVLRRRIPEVCSVAPAPDSPDHDIFRSALTCCPLGAAATASTRARERASTITATSRSRFKPHRLTASAANASGFVQTALSRVTRRMIFTPRSSTLRRVTPDRVLSLHAIYAGSVSSHLCPVSATRF